jgi:hypothetical protein
VFNITVNKTVLNSTHANITIAYTDNQSYTTGGYVYLNQSNTTDMNGPEVNLQIYNITTVNFTKNFTVTSYKGQSYFVRVRPVTTKYTLIRDYLVSFPKSEVNPMGLDDTLLMLIASFFIIFTGCLFAATTARMGPLIMTFEAGLFYAFGWLDIMGPTLPLILLALGGTLSVIVLIMERSKKERYI